MVKETLRLRPVIDAAERTLTAPRTIAGWELPAGVKVYPGIALVHMREDLYPRPHEFRPERFLDEEAESYSWVPFGGGIRRCIGAALAQAEMAEVLRVALPAVRLRPVRAEPEPVILRGITLAPKHGAEVEVAELLGRRAERVERGLPVLVDREHPVQPRDLEDLRDVLVGADQCQRPARRPQPLHAADQHAERGGVDERGLGEVDDDVLSCRPRSARPSAP